MHSVPNGTVIMSSIPGKTKNCNSWAGWERPGESETATLCHGGIFEGARYSPCDSRDECRVASGRSNSFLDSRHRLPITPASQMPMNGSRVVASTMPQTYPPVQQAAPPDKRTGYVPSGYWNPPPATAAPTSIPMRNPMPPYSGPSPVMPPESHPEVMQTPYAAPQPVSYGGASPTFLPVQNETVWERLFKNVTQGFFNAAGWQVFELTRNVDMFKFRKR